MPFIFIENYTKAFDKEEYGKRTLLNLLSPSMPVILYRHAEPEVSGDEIISGAKFALWVKKYNSAGIKNLIGRKTNWILFFRAIF